MNCSPREHAADIAVIEDVLSSGQAQRCARDHHRDEARCRASPRVKLQATSLKDISEQTTEFVVAYCRSKGSPRLRKVMEHLLARQPLLRAQTRVAQLLPSLESRL